MAKIELKNWTGYMPKAELDRITKAGEKRIGLQHFFGPGLSDMVVEVESSHATIELPVVVVQEDVAMIKNVPVRDISDTIPSISDSLFSNFLSNMKKNYAVEA